MPENDLKVPTEEMLRMIGELYVKSRMYERTVQKLHSDNQALREALETRSPNEESILKKE